MQLFRKTLTLENTARIRRHDSVRRGALYVLVLVIDVKTNVNRVRKWRSS